MSKKQAQEELEDWRRIERWKDRDEKDRLRSIRHQELIAGSFGLRQFGESLCSGGPMPGQPLVFE